MDGIPTVLQVFQAIRPNFEISEIWMAKEFAEANTPEVRKAFANVTTATPLHYEAHADLKKRVPNAIGLIRTGDTTQYANMIIVSGPIEAKLE